MITQFNIFSTYLKAHTKSDRGAAMVEYALLLALIAIVAIAALKVLGGTVSSEFSSINSGLNS
jgi:pilus assembly protein Flp/PilA